MAKRQQPIHAPAAYADEDNRSRCQG